MNAASFSNFQGGWVDWLISAIRFLRGISASHSSSSSTTIASGAKPEQADDLGVLRRAEQDDRVALLDELDELLLLLDHPGAGAVDDLEAARLGALHDVRPDAVGADDDRGAVVDVVERVDGLDARAPARSRITPSLWTTWPRVCVALPAAEASLALSIASRTP